MIRLFVLFLMIAPFTPHALAKGGATGAGDGGHGVLCKTWFKSPHGSTEDATVTLLDLFEANRLHGDHFWPSTDSSEMFTWPIDQSVANQVCGELNARRKRFQKSTGINLQAEFDRACGVAQKMQARDSLPETKDFGRLRVAIPKNCELIQIGVFYPNADNPRIFIDRMAAVVMNASQLSALAFHEVMHMRIRDHGSTEDLRSVVAYAFADTAYQQEHRAEVIRILKRL